MNRWCAGRSSREFDRELNWHAIDGEHIQGVVLLHHYEPWVLTWNVTRADILAGYSVSSPDASVRFGPARALAPQKLLQRPDAFLKIEPVEVRGQISEERIDLHVPWRKGDAAAACDALGILARHCDDFAVMDDFGIWPTKDFSRRENYANKWANATGWKPVHPDAGDDLSSAE